MNAVLVNWRNDAGDMIVTVGWVAEDNGQELTVCSDVGGVGGERQLAYRPLRIPYSRILDVTELAPQNERREVVVN
jgi:hypothetical protein|tara:strand:+ start:591 stop:818 length:228 start_codon:yes stop_codon:yes gene_type:complete